MNDSGCLVCASTVLPFESALVLDKYHAEFVRCSSCGLIFASEPSWIAESYETVYAQTDLGVADRALLNAATVALLIRLFGRGACSGVDFGGGNGLFVRLMRDRGFDFRLFEPQAENVFAGGYETDSLDFPLLTAFEVLEHLEAPHQDLGPALGRAELGFFSTALLPDPPPPLGDWWYYQLETGQHITFWTKEALRRFAVPYGLKVSSTKNFHVFAKSRIPASLLRALASARLSKFVNLWPSRKSLLESDYESRFGKRPFP